jgi:hypothetical protein
VFVVDDTGARLTGGRVPEGIAGVARFHELLAGCLIRLRWLWRLRRIARCSSPRWLRPATRCWRSIRCGRRRRPGPSQSARQR